MSIYKDYNMFLIPLSFVKSRKHVTGKAQPALTPDSAKQDFSNQAYLIINPQASLQEIPLKWCCIPK